MWLLAVILRAFHAAPLTDWKFHESGWSGLLTVDC